MHFNLLASLNIPGLINLLLIECWLYSLSSDVGFGDAFPQDLRFLDFTSPIY
jgi:hypothetical protein